MAEFAIRTSWRRRSTLAWISYVAPRSRQEIDGGEQEAPQLSGWNRPTRPRASSTRCLPDGVPPLSPRERRDEARVRAEAVGRGAEVEVVRAPARRRVGEVLVEEVGHGLRQQHGDLRLVLHPRQLLGEELGDVDLGRGQRGRHGEEVQHGPTYRRSLPAC